MMTVTVAVLLATLSVPVPVAPGLLFCGVWVVVVPLPVAELAVEGLRSDAALAAVEPELAVTVIPCVAP